MSTEQFTIIQGTSKRLLLLLTDMSDAALDLTGATLALDIGQGLNTAVPDLLLSKDMSLDIAEGTAHVDFAPGDTSTLPQGKYRAQVMITYADATVAKSDIFEFAVQQGVRAAV